MDLYDYIWIYDILLMYVFIHYWNKYVIIMHDIEKIEINCKLDKQIVNK